MNKMTQPLGQSPAESPSEPLAQSSAPLPVNSPAEESVPISALEIGSLAHELKKQYVREINSFRKRAGLQFPEAAAKVNASSAEPAVDYCLSVSVRDTDWYHLRHLAEQAPELATKRWAEMVKEADAELESGHRAAEVVERGTSTCWQRAQFLVLRESLAEEWRPRSGIEWALIDAMALARTEELYWYHHLINFHEYGEDVSTTTKPIAPRVPMFKLVEQAGAMIDRFNRIFMRALRQLRDLRRYTVVVQAEQVNIGQNQVNVRTANNTCKDEPGMAPDCS